MREVHQVVASSGDCVPRAVEGQEVQRLRVQHSDLHRAEQVTKDVGLLG